MLRASAERIQNRLSDDDVVLDVGGWAVPFARADWVIDLMPYESRGAYGDWDRAAERFGPERWIERDICDRERWPFEDDQFDFAVCAQTLEDVRDPVWVCSELNRVARAGYVEVPSRLEEQSLGVQGNWAGYSHHRWLIDVVEGRIEFVFKSHVVNAREEFRFPAGFADGLSPDERVQQLWWDGGFDYGERILIDTEEHDRHLASFVAAHPALAPPERRLLRSRIARRLRGGRTDG
jgi:hypothetical protein